MRPKFPDFASVLNEVEADAGRTEEIHRPQFGLASAVFSAGLGDAPDAPRHTENLEALFDVEPAAAGATLPEAEAERQAITRRMQNQSPDAIGGELALRPGLKRAEIQRLRRRFAAENHPDRLPQEFRAAAEQRMKTANALLDAAMAAASS
ncbi:hypothetical protein FHS76_000099 [Ochrobactrum daejeonense]|uniref:J domain-containing protein n=1 Tax=Brucella daejeonensis TaxID=659015 RepID=A0A7W9EL32_9HYPH|nr:hypothetical protein [Brucella daejeonensis]MBB5700261.1 hypothetical protein [Brucella daejeonensis]NKB78491.1 hypothetical protein [Brucella daejeonensis]